MTKKRLGIVGCGTIGSEIAIAVSNGQIGGYVLSGVCDVDASQATLLNDRLHSAVEILDLEALLAASDIVFEATNKSSMPTVARETLGVGKPILIMSAGGLVDDPELVDLAEGNGGLLYCPSGAICGLDGILAAREAGLRRVQITSTKHPRSLIGAPYLARQKVSIENLAMAKTIFEGSAREAIAAFPANANVAIILGAAGLGIDRTEVSIVADPSCTRTRHEIVAEGEFGSVRTITEGTVAPNNPRTSYLAILSAKAALVKISSRFRIGT